MSQICLPSTLSIFRYPMQGQSSQPWLSPIYSQHRWLIPERVRPAAGKHPAHNALQVHPTRRFWGARDPNAARNGTFLLCARQAENSARFLGASSIRSPGGILTPSRQQRHPGKGAGTWGCLLLSLGKAWLSPLGDRLQLTPRSDIPALPAAGAYVRI